MTDQHIPLRKKLSPKNPSTVLKKRRTFVVYNRRDCELTANQQSWAHSLAASLSGWRTRHAFLKAQLESHLKAEAERAAEKAMLKAALQAQEDERQAQIATLQAEADAQFARDAAAYQKEASQIHQTNIENKTEEELDDEDYMYKYITNLCEYGSSAKRPDDQDEESIDGDQPNVKIADFTSPNIPSPTQMSLSPAAPSVKTVDWRIKAHSGIAKKKLTIDKGWSAFTWNQKSNIHERLLLLEDDGYDITEIQDREVSSEEITAIILERAAAQTPDNTSVPLKKKPVSPNLIPDVQTSLPETLQSVVGKSASLLPASPDHLSTANAESPTKPPPVSSHQNSSATILELMVPLIVENDTQPFCLDEPYHPRASARLKRKRESDSDAEDLEYTAADLYPALNKRNIRFISDEELRAEALQEIRYKVLRRVFRPTRSICQEPSPFSKVVFSAAVLRSRPEQKTKSIGTLDYLYAKQPVSITFDEPLSIKVTGYEKILAELRFLTNTSSTDGTSMTITDPDYDDEELDSTAAYRSEVGGDPSHVLSMKKNTHREKSRIVISKDEQNRQIFQGDTLTLAELFKVLQQRELFHSVDWEWDGLRLAPSNSLLWSLGPETQETLRKIELRLRQYAEPGGAEICVRRVTMEK